MAVRKFDDIKIENEKKNIKVKLTKEEKKDKERGEEAEKIRVKRNKKS